ncbi:MAG: aliphatic sulfonate ABC transporter permease SsuC [Azospirillaceae bacterium]|nr:aliphatic sulfonate ABC transporter permease SsuC [Azospirillaceae bacterium]
MSRASRSAVGERLTPFLVPVLIVVLWQGLASAGWLSTRVLPAPTAVATAAWTLTRSGELPHHLAVSFVRALSGFVVGGGIGFCFGLANGLSRLSERLFDSTMQMVRNIPHLALIPLVILWFGIDEEAKLFLVALGVMFPIYFNTFHGIRTIDDGLLEMARTHQLGSWSMFWQVILPGALPSILVGVRYALGIMWLTLIVAETIAASSGIGYMAMTAREFLQTDIVVVSILLYAALGKAADSAARGLERVCLSWHPAFGRGQA